MDNLDFSDSNDTYAVCPHCGRRVEPDARYVLYARKQVDVPGFGQRHDFVDGKGGFFHFGCEPGDVGYARRPRPGS
jgi:hypothetical protein